jgi:hypothetical protein
MKTPINRVTTHGPPAPRAARPEPVRCIIGETIREVRFWTEEEWEALAPEERPSPAEHIPELGWVGAVRG